MIDSQLKILGCTPETEKKPNGNVNLILKNMMPHRTRKPQNLWQCKDLDILILVNLLYSSRVVIGFALVCDDLRLRDE